MPGKLSAYHAKRNFHITAEPHGSVEASSDELRFVVQRHDAKKLHYDFRLEIDGTLKSWAIPKGPSLDPADKRLAVQVEDHPIDYADFEGIIPEHQYGAGTMEIWDSGVWEPRGDPAAGYRDGKLSFHLYGNRLQGGWTLLRTRLPGSGNKQQWLLIKDRDEAARPAEDSDAASARAPSAAAKKSPARKKQAGATERSAQNAKPRTKLAQETPLSPVKLDAALRAPMPESINAQLATLVDTPPADDGDWVYEIKYDGYRILARIDQGKVTLHTRDGKDWTAKLPKQVQALQNLPLKNAWLDGEIVVLDEHDIPSFQRLQNAFDKKSTAEILFFVFDLLYLDGYDLRSVPLIRRRTLLDNLLGHFTTGPLRYSAALHEPAEKLLDSACRLSMEGIIGKRNASLYTGKRSSDWIKLKCRKRQEFVIAGYTDPQGARKHFGSLLLGVYGDDGQLHYAGRVGTGFDTSILKSTYQQLKPLKQKSSAFDDAPRRIGATATHWVKPQLVAEISFAEWTKDGLVRQAVFHGLRMDKPAQQVKREQATPIAPKAPVAKSRKSMATPTDAGAVLQGVTITHPERVIDPDSGLTKLDLARYYHEVAPHILPFLKGRPVYLLRSPGGMTGKAFFQRHAARTAIPGIDVLDPSVDPEHLPLMVINSAQALVSAAQMGTIELHSCNAKADLFEKPDCMVFDLDPDPALPWKAVKEAAHLTRALLTELGLTSFLKTSGSKGLHLVVPLARRHSWESVTRFSEAVAQHLATTFPNRFSAKMGEHNRVGKVYIDYLRNQKMASTVAPYSVRAKSGLAVSTPLHWDELDSTTGSAMWNIATLPERLSKLDSDPWENYWVTRQSLPKGFTPA